MLAFSPDGRHLLAAGRDGTARVWQMDVEPPGNQAYDLSSGSAHYLRAVRQPGQSEEISYSPAGDRELRFGKQPGVRIVARATGERAAPTLAADEVVEMAYASADGRRVVTVGSHRVRVWDAQSGELFGQPIPVVPGLFRTFASHDAARVCTVDPSGTIQVWAVEQGTILLRLTHKGTESAGLGDKEP